MSDNVRKDDFDKYQGAGDIRVLTLDNQHHPGNTLTQSTIRQLLDFVLDGRDRTIFLTHAGATFSGGLDRYELLRACAHNKSCKPLLEPLIKLYAALSQHPQPTACELGNAAGGGFGLALCCDVVVARSDAKFRIPGGGYRELARVLLPIIEERGPTRGGSIEDFIGSDFTGAEAQTWGLIDHVVPTANVIRQAALDALKKKGLWPPVTRLPRWTQDTIDRIDYARSRAITPEATRAIAGGLIYETIRAIEGSLP